MIVFLTKSDASEGFNQIVDFLTAHTIQYALMVNPTIYVSCIKQFWAPVLIKKSNDVVKLQALIDRKKVIITEDTIRQALRLDDADGIDFLPNEEIFAELARMGYEKPGLPGMNLVLPWPRLSSALPQDDDEVEEDEDDNEVSTASTPPSPTFAITPPSPQQEPIPSPPQAQPAYPSSPLHHQPAASLESLMTLLNTLMETSQRVKSSNDTVMDDQEDTSKQGGIAKLDADEDVTLMDVNADTHGRMEEDVTAVKDINVAESEPTVFDDEEEKEDLERAKVLQKQYDQKQEDIDWNIITEQMQEKHLDNVKMYQSLKRKPISVAQARKNMRVYLKNMVGYKIQHFKGITYDQRTEEPIQAIQASNSAFMPVLWRWKLIGVMVMKLTTGRLVNGSSCDGIDMVINFFDLEPKVYAMVRDFLEISLQSCGLSRWKELSKESGSKILPCGDGSCWKMFKPIASDMCKDYA
nr:hypothetical protein [Tanacetum cinerariifolium]